MSDTALSWSQLQHPCDVQMDNKGQPERPIVLQLELQSQTQSFVRKSQALASALHQQSRTPAALSRLGNALALLASLGVRAVRSGQPLVQMLVTLRASLQGRPSAAATGKPGSR